MISLIYYRCLYGNSLRAPIIGPSQPAHRNFYDYVPVMLDSLVDAWKSSLEVIKALGMIEGQKNGRLLDDIGRLILRKVGGHLSLIEATPFKHESSSKTKTLPGFSQG